MSHNSEYNFSQYGVGGTILNMLGFTWLQELLYPNNISSTKKIKLGETFGFTRNDGLIVDGEYYLSYDEDIKLTMQVGDPTTGELVPTTIGVGQDQYIDVNMNDVNLRIYMTTPTNPNEDIDYYINIIVL